MKTRKRGLATASADGDGDAAASPTKLARTRANTLRRQSPPSSDNADTTVVASRDALLARIAQLEAELAATRAAVSFASSATTAAVAAVVDADSAAVGATAGPSDDVNFRMLHTMSPSQVFRYSRQLLVPDIAVVGQQRFLASKVLVVGCGGLGGVICLYLAGAGVGTVGVCDGDTVQVDNLHRQVIFRECDIDTNKAVACAAACHARNSAINMRVHEFYLTHERALSLFEQYDVIIDATDNIDSRFLINDAAVCTGRMIVCGSAIGVEGQVAVFGYNARYLHDFSDVSASAARDAADAAAAAPFSTAAAEASTAAVAPASAASVTTHTAAERDVFYVIPTAAPVSPLLSAVPLSARHVSSTSSSTQSAPTGGGAAPQRQRRHNSGTGSNRQVGDSGRGPCRRCIFPRAPKQLETCETEGVLGVVPGMIGMMQALECLKLLRLMRWRPTSVTTTAELLSLLSSSMPPIKTSSSSSSSSSSATADAVPASADATDPAAIAAELHRQQHPPSQLQPLVGKLLVFDARTSRFSQFQLCRERVSSCRVCGDAPVITTHTLSLSHTRASATTPKHGHQLLHHNHPKWKQSSASTASSSSSPSSSISSSPSASASSSTHKQPLTASLAVTDDSAVATVTTTAHGREILCTDLARHIARCRRHRRHRQPYVLLDVRPRQQFAMCHLHTAVNVPYSELIAWTSSSLSVSSTAHTGWARVKSEITRAFGDIMLADDDDEDDDGGGSSGTGDGSNAGSARHAGGNADKEVAVPVYVVCRAGNDSAEIVWLMQSIDVPLPPNAVQAASSSSSSSSSTSSATSAATAPPAGDNEHGNSSSTTNLFPRSVKVQSYNVHGGIIAWRNTVDATFPRY